MEEERDYVVFTDEDGNDFELDVIDYFDYKGEEYAVLIDAEGECDCGKEPGKETDAYIMKIIVDEQEETEEFVPPADEDMDALIELVQKRFEEGDCCGEECNPDEEHHCDCGCLKE